MRRHFYILILVAFVAITTGCSSSQQNDTQPNTAPELHTPWNPGALPPVPDGRSVSASFSATQQGSDVLHHSPNSTIAGDDLILTSGLNSISWGIWEFSPGQQYVTSAEIVMSVPEGLEAWIAVADYEQQAWDFEGPLSGGMQITLESSRHKSPEGLSYLAVMTHGGNSATIDRVICNWTDGWNLTVAETMYSANHLSGTRRSLKTIRPCN